MIDAEKVQCYVRRCRAMNEIVRDNAYASRVNDRQGPQEGKSERNTSERWGGCCEVVIVEEEEDGGDDEEEARYLIS